VNNSATSVTQKAPTKVVVNHSNADQAELSKFSDLAHHWWDKSSEFAPLHAINALLLYRAKMCWMSAVGVAFWQMRWHEVVQPF
jgi:hypothetical protein